MTCSELLSLLNIIIAAIGVLFVVFAMIEWAKLRKIRKDFPKFEERLRRDIERQMRAAHRVISSYSITDTDARIKLLESTAQDYPDAFNVYNALGYAYIEKGAYDNAADAFHNAIKQRPDDKAGYCDLARLYAQKGENDLAIKFVAQAVAVDPAVYADIKNDKLLKTYLI